MGALTERRAGLKTQWKNLSARARLGESFGFIDALVVLYKCGHVPKELAFEIILQRVTAEDLKEYRRIRNVDPLS